MTSQKSFQNNFGFAYRSGLRDNALFAVLQTAFLALFYCAMPISVFQTKFSSDPETGELARIDYKTIYSFLLGPTQDMLSFFRYFILLGLLGFGILFGIMAFRFITGKKTINVYYSLGIKRAKLFSARYLAGLTLIAAAVLAPLLVTFLFNLAELGFSRYLLLGALYQALGLFTVTAFSFTLTALVFSTVGTAFEGVLFSGILLLTPEFLCRALETLITKLVPGTPLGANFQSMYVYNGFDLTESLARAFQSFNPLRFFADGLFTYASAGPKGELTSVQNGELVAWTAPAFLLPALWLLVTAGLFFAGMYAYKRRKAEIGGFIGKNRVLNFVGTFLIGFFGFVLAFSVLERRGIALAAAVGAVVFLVLVLLTYLLLLRNLRLFKKALTALPVQVCIVAFLFALFATGYFGAANRVPETADIASAKITALQADYSDEAADTYYFGMNGFESPNTLPVGQYTSARDIDFVRGIHKALASAGRLEATAPNADYNGVRPVSLRISYTMKDGSELLRNYYGVPEDVLLALQNAVETDYRQSVLDKLFRDPLTPVERPKDNPAMGGNVSETELTAYRQYQYIELIRETGDVVLYDAALARETVLTLTEAQRAALLDALYRDLSAETPESHYDGQTVGLLCFEDRSGDDGAEEQNYDWKGEPLPEGMFTGKEALANEPDFYLTADMENTLAFLRSIGAENALTPQRQPEKIYSVKVSQLFSSTAVEVNLDYRENFACEFRAASGTNAYLSELTGYFVADADSNTFDGIYCAKDDAQQAALLSRAALRGTLEPNDYILVLYFEDGLQSKLYVHAEDMPAAQKAAIEKNPTFWY